jgi:hypothetical protein
LAEERDLVDAGGICNPTSGRATKAVLREYFGGSGKDFVSAVHGVDINEELPKCK